jgi:2-C-methyl-D-erythritol 2,4-cyclodiphosphate synthase
MQQELSVGIGFDSHPLVSGRKLVLGGVDIPYDRGLAGWSDADVLVHAVIDALCGAAGLGDIGTLFPPADRRYKGISSLVLLRKVGDLIKARGVLVVNIDATVIAEEPRLTPFIPEMRKKVGMALGIDAVRVSIKATTTNALGFIGRGEGMAAQAVALARRSETPASQDDQAGRDH